jgi:phosphopentomutase
MLKKIKEAREFKKEVKELKKMKLQYQVLLLGKVYDVVQLFDGGVDILELAEKMKNVDEKDLVDALVKNVTNKEKSE